MFVRDGPAAVDFAQADRQAKIQPLRLTVGSGFCAAHRGDDKRHVAASGDAHIGDIEQDWIDRPRKEQSQDAR